MGIITGKLSKILQVGDGSGGLVGCRLDLGGLDNGEADQAILTALLCRWGM